MQPAPATGTTADQASTTAEEEDRVPQQPSTEKRLDEFATRFERLETLIAELASQSQPQPLGDPPGTGDTSQPALDTSQQQGRSLAVSLTTSDTSVQQTIGPRMHVGAQNTSAQVVAKTPTGSREKSASAILDQKDNNNNNNTAENSGMLSQGVGADSLPHIDVLSSQLRSDILAGKDVNLAAILLPDLWGSDNNQRHFMVGQDCCQAAN